MFKNIKSIFTGNKRQNPRIMGTMQGLALAFILALFFGCRTNGQEIRPVQTSSIDPPRTVYIMGGDIESNGSFGLHVNAFIPENMLSLVKTGMKVVIRVSGLDGRLFNGEIMNIYPEIDAKSMTSLVDIRFFDASPYLRPGMIVMIGCSSKAL